MTVFGDSINFMVKLGVYDIVLPFLLVFVLVFALLDKTKVLGMDKVVKDGKEYPKKSLEAMIAFVTGFFVVASSQLVSVINKSVSQIFILLLMIVLFLMVAGAMHQQSDKGFFLDPKNKQQKFYYNAFMAVIFIAIIAIFLNALGWLQLIYDFLKNNWNADYVATIIFVIIIIGFMAWVTGDPASKSDEKEEKKS